MQLVVASNNAHKITEIRQILDGRFDICTMADKGLHIDIEENGDTLLANALIKAKTVCQATGCVALADDTGLFVHALNGAPGLYAARYAGPQHNDADNRAKLLQELSLWPDAADRTAYFCTVVVLYYPDGHYLVGEGRCTGHILHAEVGDKGFGYDTLFWSDDLQCSFAQCAAEAKNSVSHRTRALQALVQQL